MGRASTPRRSASRTSPGCTRRCSACRPPRRAGWARPGRRTGCWGRRRAVRLAVRRPLPGHGGPVGAVILLRRDDRVPFGEEEESFLHMFAARAGAAISGPRC
ncbi:hypothetical protein NKH77_54380 [Streptomyces sp. M19]